MSIRRDVGRIAQLYRYPVKSMAGESLDAVDVSWHGVAGDRRWAFVRPDHQAHGFPWQTIREEPRMCLFSARLRDPDRPEASTVDVRTPDGTELTVTDPLLPDLIGSGLRLMRLNRGTFDTLPMSLITTATVDALCQGIVAEADSRRFRPNLVIEADEPFAEDAWVGGTLQIGTAVLRVDKRDSRCAVITVDASDSAGHAGTPAAGGHGAELLGRCVRLRRQSGHRARRATCLPPLLSGALRVASVSWAKTHSARPMHGLKTLGRSGARTSSATMGRWPSKSWYDEAMPRASTHGWTGTQRGWRPCRGPTPESPTPHGRRRCADVSTGCRRRVPVGWRVIRSVAETNRRDGDR